MNKQSRSSGTRKPSREDLLKELESIHDTLAEDESPNHDIPATNHNDNAVLDAQALEDQTQMSEETADSDSTLPLAEKQQASTPEHPGQQSLFTAPSTAAEKEAQKKEQKAAALENPFLPAHIKERLEREKSLYQQEIDAAVKIPGLNPYAEKSSVNDLIIDELVKMYLPQIEEELRRRLKQNLDQTDD